MDREIFRKIIIENQEILRAIKLNKRDFEFEDNGNYVLVGVRHAGKSYLLYQRAFQLLEEGHRLEEIAYINFDDERLYKMDVSDFDYILEAYASMYALKPIFFFDEIQNIEGWDHFARRLANQNYRVYITGSNAKMLSRDIATVLGERYLNGKVYPYSYKEFLSAKEIYLTANWEYGNQSRIISRMFEEYFVYGGFPEVLKYQNKRSWLNSLFERIFFSDMVVRNGVRNEQALRLTIKRMAENLKQPTSYNRLSNLVKATGVSTTTASVIEYVNYMRESCLIFSLENYRSKFVDKETIKKHYFVDNGLLNVFLDDADTFLLENLCAVHLYRKYGDKLYYFKLSEEVDFYVPDEGLGVQVAYSIRSQEVRKREIAALDSLDSIHNLKRMIIVTRDEEGTAYSKSGREIEIIPVWRWILQ